jgi:hypothetical protein
VGEFWRGVSNLTASAAHAAAAIVPAAKLVKSKRGNSLEFSFQPDFWRLFAFKNWQTLGKQSEATATKIWLLNISVMVLLSALLMSISLLFIWFVALALSVVWYLTSGRKQIHYVENVLHNNYSRRG